MRVGDEGVAGCVYWQVSVVYTEWLATRELRVYRTCVCVCDTKCSLPDFGRQSDLHCRSRVARTQ